MTKKASDVNEILLCDNNTVKTHHVNRSDFFLRNLAFWTRYSIKKPIIFISNKVYKDLKANKARWTSPMTKKVFDANELLCDSNTVKAHQVNWSDFKKRLGFVDKIFSKKTIIFISNKVCKDVKANKERWTSPMTIKASDANEFLCDNHSNHAEPHVF